MNEFEEIPHSGGKIKFRNLQEGKLAINFTHSNPWEAKLFQICVSFNGIPLEVLPFAGMGKQGTHPQPSILVWIISDKQGMFGRICPECNLYFRTDFCGRLLYCPYCGYFGYSLEFITKNQKEYISIYCNEFMKAYNRDVDEIEIDFDIIIDKLSNNKPRWVYSEEKQQNTYNCQKCQLIFDILGEYGGCPGCNMHNSQEVIEKKLSELEKRFEKSKENIADRHDREVEWENLTRCISEFEAMANDIRNHLIKIPSTPKRRCDISRLSFQQILKANDCINNWFGFEIFKGISDNDRNFLNIMFNRRHVFTHNAGVVDQEYLDNTGDTKIRLHQKIHLRSREIKRLIPLVREVSNNLIFGFKSIS